MPTSPLTVQRAVSSCVPCKVSMLTPKKRMIASVKVGKRACVQRCHLHVEAGHQLLDEAGERGEARGGEAVITAAERLCVSKRKGFSGQTNTSPHSHIPTSTLQHQTNTHRTQTCVPLYKTPSTIPKSYLDDHADGNAPLAQRPRHIVENGHLAEPSMGCVVVGGGQHFIESARIHHPKPHRSTKLQVACTMGSLSPPPLPKYIPQAPRLLRTLARYSYRPFSFSLTHTPRVSTRSSTMAVSVLVGAEGGG